MRADKVVAVALSVVLLVGPVVGQVAQARMISTPAIAAETDPHDELRAFLAREEVRAEMHRLGVDPAQAAARVSRLTDAEARALAGQLAELPAGGADLVGALVFVFVVLLVTDILGFTNVFPFVVSTVER